MNSYYVFPDGCVWRVASGNGTLATVTPDGCYPEVVPVSGTLTEQDAKKLLAAAPRRRLNDPDVEREVAARVGSAGEPVLGYEW